MLLRALYVALLRLHPREFRERFGEEMAGIFDEEARRGMPFLLLLDGLVSLFRQRVLRHGYSRPSVALAGGTAAVADMPLFQTLEIPPPRVSVLIHGAVLSLLFFATVSFGISQLDGSNAEFLFGARYPRSPVLSVNPSAVEEGEAIRESKVAAPSVDPLDGVAAAYFKTIRVLGALDADGDHTISATEIEGAPEALARLDRNGDGELGADEYGFPASTPVVEALDSDGDAKISRREIERSADALKTLDQDRDGRLTVLEVLPHVEGEVASRRRILGGRP